MLVMLLGVFSGSVVQAEEYGTLYVYGYLKHFNPRPTVHEGGMELLGFSKELHHGLFQFDTGANTYVDSYGKRSYSVFSDISHADFNYGILTPVLGLTCTYKGADYDSDRMQTYCLPVPKVRIGEKTGVFANLAGLPKVGSYTNGWLALELGYKW